MEHTELATQGKVEAYPSPHHKIKAGPHPNWLSKTRPEPTNSAQQYKACTPVPITRQGRSSPESASPYNAGAKLKLIYKTRPGPTGAYNIRQRLSPSSRHQKDRPKQTGAYTIGQGQSPTGPAAQDRDGAPLNLHHETRPELAEPVTQDMAGAYLNREP